MFQEMKEKLEGLGWSCDVREKAILCSADRGESFGSIHVFRYDSGEYRVYISATVFGKGVNHASSYFYDRCEFYDIERPVLVCRAYRADRSLMIFFGERRFRADIEEGMQWNWARLEG